VGFGKAAIQPSILPGWQAEPSQGLGAKGDCLARGKSRAWRDWRPNAAPGEIIPLIPSPPGLESALLLWASSSHRASPSLTFHTALNLFPCPVFISHLFSGVFQRQGNVGFPQWKDWEKISQGNLVAVAGRNLQRDRAGCPPVPALPPCITHPAEKPPEFPFWRQNKMQTSLDQTV